ncbi:DUF1471 domain-containing protein [Shimwellia pseudoproteus]|uniref:YdgH/BhsA/McbA-like domain containing protein n=1 Tax=Shimwellia pseudoproteus TaxID=570012 RepID=UPI0018EDEC26|nr:YdgH/BhsA/McbA-like domain containing protein [Shimwellia pseudoproteus]MBJ3814892.1 DUF1471 domain-containing protein [Shimwellia pseudoproteus]
MKNTRFALAALGLLATVSFGAGATASEINADQARNLHPMGSIGVSQIAGSPSDLLARVARKATREGAGSYMITELHQGNNWHATAELYQ